MSKTKYQQKLEDNKQKIQELLGSEYIFYQMESFRVEEDMSSNLTSIKAELATDEPETYYLSGSGRGSVDALWNALRPIKEDYGILDQISFEGYKAEAVELDKQLISTDAKVDVEVEMSSLEKDRMVINKRSYSVLRASILCFLEMTEYLVNSQKAFKKLQILIEDSQERNRQDLKNEYIDTLSELTRMISHKNLKD